MKNVIYYFKTVSDTWNFSDGDILPAPAGAMKKAKLQKGGISVERLYLNVPEHYQVIRESFPGFPQDATWRDIYSEIRHPYVENPKLQTH